MAGEDEHQHARPSDSDADPVDDSAIRNDVELTADEAEQAVEDETRALLSPRKIASQVLGFAVGLALLAWCIYGAIQGGETQEGPGAWQRISEASWWLIAGLVVSTVISLLANGAIFWVVIRPIQPLRFAELQWLNMTAAFLNYAPIKLGLIARIVHHLRVDRLPLLRLAGWFAAIAFTLALTIGAVLVATLLSPEVNLLWLGLLLAPVILGGLLTRALMTHPLIIKFGRGMHVMLSRPAALWGAIGLRLIDFGAFAGRVGCAAAILQLDLSARDVLLIALATLVLTFNPIGRVGIREAGVAIVASMLTSAEMSLRELDSHMQQLALLDSAGEALAIVPLGIVSLMWYKKMWRRAKTSKYPNVQTSK